jgi:BirA family biotin operon repressor/biotin-[acetyl-CoA-carboxylase] ligase
MDDMAQKSAAGAPHLATQVAERIENARGRRGRVWQHEEGKNLAITTLVRSGVGDHLPLVVGLSTCRAIRQVSGANAMCKWPNDVRIQGKKVAGVLVEKTPDAAIVGVGINVLARQTPFPSTLNATTLQDETGLAIDRIGLLNRFFSELDEQLKTYATRGWAALADNYLSLCETIGQPVKWEDETGTISGIAETLDHDGTLLLRTVGGLIKIRSGDIVNQGKNHEQKTTATP